MSAETIAANEAAYQQALAEAANDLNVEPTSLAVRRRALLLCQHRALTRAIINGEPVATTELLALETALAQNAVDEPIDLRVSYVDDDAAHRIKNGGVAKPYDNTDEGRAARARDEAKLEAEIEKRVAERIRSMGVRPTEVQPPRLLKRPALDGEILRPKPSPLPDRSGPPRRRDEVWPDVSAAPLPSPDDQVDPAMRHRDLSAPQRKPEEWDGYRIEPNKR